MLNHRPQTFSLLIVNIQQIWSKVQESAFFTRTPGNGDGGAGVDGGGRHEENHCSVTENSEFSTEHWLTSGTYPTQFSEKNCSFAFRCPYNHLFVQYGRLPVGFLNFLSEKFALPFLSDCQSSCVCPQSAIKVICVSC